MVKYFQIRAKDECVGTYLVIADSYEEAIAKIKVGSWDDYTLEDLASYSEPWDFQLEDEWETFDPESSEDDSDSNS